MGNLVSPLFPSGSQAINEDLFSSARSLVSTQDAEEVEVGGRDETGNNVECVIKKCLNYRNQARAEYDEKNYGASHILYFLARNVALEYLGGLSKADMEYGLLLEFAQGAQRELIELENEQRNAVRHGQRYELFVPFTVTQARDNPLGASAPPFAGEVDEVLTAARLALRRKFQEDSMKKMSFEDIIGYKDVKNDIMESLIFPREMRQVYQIDSLVTSVLFYGCPGTGKTIFCESLAAALDYGLLTMSGLDSLDEYDGTNVQTIRACFDVAKEYGPCILFFDEIESLFPDKSTTTEFKIQYNELSRHNEENPGREVVLVAASSQPGSVNPAVCRQFSKFIHVPLPTEEERQQILSHMLVNFNVFPGLNDLNWKCIRMNTFGFTFADLKVLCQDIEQIPLMKLRNAKFFMEADNCNPINVAQLEGLRKELEQFMSANKLGLAEMKEQEVYKKYRSAYEAVMTSKYFPCSGSVPGAVGKSYKDFLPEEIGIPSISPVDIVHASERRAGSQDLLDVKGSVKMCEAFHVLRGNRVQIEKDMRPDEKMKFNFEKYLEEAEERAIKRGYISTDDEQKVDLDVKHAN